MFSRRSGTTIGVGGGDRVHLTETGVVLDGELRVDGDRAPYAIGAYAWDELLDLRVRLRPAPVGERLLAVFERLPIHEDVGDTDYSLYGHVVVQAMSRARSDVAVSVQVPMKLRWHPGRQWIDRIQEDISHALADPAERRRFA